MVADTVRTWAKGWAVSRRCPAPVAKPWGLYIEVVGSAREVGRHLLPEVDVSLVRAAALSVTEPRTWLKMPAEPERIEPWLPAGWAVVWEGTGHLMVTDLAPSEQPPPAGYTAEVEVVGDVIVVRARDAAGERAAQGQIALVGEAAIADQVVTDEAHRRRGLGHFVMRTLASQALERGAHLGVLGATDDGRALYETLGWKKHATLAECAYRAQG
ncbi:GNAT family N-acetyltransferase [Streptomyces sp. 796.1]|uniref:GNAT family N-acetyltransferase n=1 Tax=Streptomyces sp. 796.1 TaxID=3163029 RepID=UPI0039C96F11